MYDELTEDCHADQAYVYIGPYLLVWMVKIYYKFLEMSSGIVDNS